MDLSLEPSRDGSPTCRAGQLHLHSPYSPQREAERFIEANIGDAKPSCVVLLGPCLDYLSPLLRSRVPAATIVSVQYSAFFRGAERGRADATWYPDSALSLASFLDGSVDEDAVSGVTVLEWPAAARAFSELAAACGAALKASLDRLVSSAATVKVFGKRWLINACRSFLLAERLAQARTTELPIVIAAAGPSLPVSLSDLAPWRGSFRLIAVSSALAACRAEGLEPDIVVATDGGAWSRPHLYPLVRRPAALATTLTALPSAALMAALPLVLIDQGSFVESELLPGLGGGLALPPHGTVAGTALQLAGRLSQGPVIFAGLDLAGRESRDHTSPHAFDFMLAAGTCRLDSHEARAFGRCLESLPLPLGTGLWRGSRSLSAYGGALADDARAWPGRVFRLRPSAQALPGIPGLDAAGLSALLGPTGRVTDGKGCGEDGLLGAVGPAAPIAGRLAHLAGRITAWRRLAAETARELAGAALPDDPRVRELLRSLDLPDWAAARRAVLVGGDPGPAARNLASRVDAALSDLESRLFP